jgi:hypothetical protein
MSKKQQPLEIPPRWESQVNVRCGVSIPMLSLAQLDPEQAAAVLGGVAACVSASRGDSAALDTDQENKP